MSVWFCLPDNAIGLNGPATDCANELRALVIIGDVVLTCGMNGKLANADALSRDEFETLGALTKRPKRDLRSVCDVCDGVKSRAPCDVSDGAGDNGCGVRGLELRFSSTLSGWLAAEGARDKFSTDLLCSANMALIALECVSSLVMRDDMF